MKNFIQRGETITFTAPVGGVVGGGVILAGRLLGVAVTDAAAGEAVEAMVEGVFMVPKVSADAVAAGDALYWSGAAMTKTVGSNVRVAVAVKAAGAGATTVTAKLCPGIG